MRAAAIAPKSSRRSRSGSGAWRMPVPRARRPMISTRGSARSAERRWERSHDPRRRRDGDAEPPVRSIFRDRADGRVGLRAADARPVSDSRQSDPGSRARQLGRHRARGPRDHRQQRAAADQKKQDEAKALEAPPVKGTVVFGGDTRLLMQFRDDALQVFYVLDIVNNARNRVDIGGPLIIDLPSSAAGAGTLEGTTPSATVNGNRLTVVGPFAPGTTSVQIGYQLRHDTSKLQFEQTWPAALQQVTVGVQKVGNLTVS